MRGFTLDAQGVLNPIDNGHFGFAPNLPPIGMGGINIQLGPPRPAGSKGKGVSMVAVVYSVPDVDLQFRTFKWSCPFGTPGSRAWNFIYSNDDGATWSSPTTVHFNPFYKICFLNNKVWAIERETFVYEPTSQAFFFAGRDIANHVVVRRSGDNGATWTTVRTFGQAGGEAMMPQLAVDGAGTIGLSWYESVFPWDRLVVNFSYSRNGTDWSQPLEIFPPFVPHGPATNDDRALGDYNALIAVPGDGQIPAMPADFVASITASPTPGSVPATWISRIRLPPR